MSARNEAATDHNRSRGAGGIIDDVNARGRDSVIHRYS